MKVEYRPIERRHRVAHVPDNLEKMYYEFDAARYSSKFKTERDAFKFILSLYGDYIAGMVTIDELEVVEIKCIT